MPPPKPPARQEPPPGDHLATLHERWRRYSDLRLTMSQQQQQQQQQHWPHRAVPASDQAAELTRDASLSHATTNMTATPPSLTTPPPPPLDHTQPLFSIQDYSAVFHYPSSYPSAPADPPSPAPPSQIPNGSIQAAPNHDREVDAAAYRAAGIEAVREAERDFASSMPPPPPTLPTNNDPLLSHLDPQVDGVNATNNDAPPREGGGEDEHDESSVDDDSEDEERQQENANSSWQAIFEDKHEPDAEEISYWESVEEHSALDPAHFEEKAFFDLGDPELVAGPSGCIDLSIDRFNGTRESPNNELVVRSDVVNIGGYGWRIKFYPKGNDNDESCPSGYIENVTMQDPEWAATEEFADPALPLLTNNKAKIKKRRSVAAQVSLVVYNPTEPRVHEQYSDAHQFSKESNDYGWTRLTRHRRRDLGLRHHCQRTPLLQDDKLALRAYVCVVHDPTGCLWNHEKRSMSRYRRSVSIAGLRPFSQILPILATDIVLLHFAPFRELVSQWQQGKHSSKFVSWMSLLLGKMLSRERSDKYGHPSRGDDSDVISWLESAVTHLQRQEGSRTAFQLLGPLAADKAAAVGGNRLCTKEHPSVQAALDAHPTTLETPALLTLELQRQKFDREERCWTRITNKVELQNAVSVGGKSYTLFAFITHRGELSSNDFNTYIRPKGVGSVWYAYTNREVKCMTHQQALEKRCGRNDADEKADKRASRLHGRSYLHDFEVAHVVFYVRDDYKDAAFASSKEIDWQATKSVKKDSITETLEAATNGIDGEAEKQDVPEEPSADQQRIPDDGSATPTHVFTDDDGDVVMSDMEEESPTSTLKDAPIMDTDPPLKHPSKTWHNTFDHLGRDYYSGEMLGNKYHGTGHLISTSGDEYHGAFELGCKHGHGTQTYAAKGDTYVGAWVGGVPHGAGTYTEKGTGNVFEGNWKEGKRSGRFTLTGTVTEEDRGVCGICFEKDMDTAFYDCGHVVACRACADMVEDCPVCRRRVASRLTLYGVKVRLE